MRRTEPPPQAKECRAVRHSLAWRPFLGATVRPRTCPCPALFVTKTAGEHYHYDHTVLLLQHAAMFYITSK